MITSKVAELLYDDIGMSHRFMIVIDKSDYNLGTWSRASGLSVSWTPCVYRAGDSNDLAVLPGNIRYANIKLSRAACSASATVQKWLTHTTKSLKPLSGAVMMMDFAHMPVVTWELKQFYPIGWSITDFDSSGAKAAVETLELAHTGFLNDEVKR